jgi:hypothetical protein
MGARPLSRKIDELIRVPLSKQILFKNLKDTTMTVNLVDGKLEFDNSVFDHGEDHPTVDTDGYIVINRFKPRA